MEGVPMSTVTKTPPKLSDDFRELLDRVGRNPAKVDGDNAKVGGLLREPAHQPDVARPMRAKPEIVGLAEPGLPKSVEFGSDNDPNLEHRPSLAAQGIDKHLALDAMAGPALDEIRPSLGKRASRRLVRFLIVFSIGVGTTLAWQWYGDAARAMIATSWPQLASLAPEPTPAPEQTAPEQTAAAPQATASPELQQLKEDLAQVKQELQQFKEIPAALASLQQSVDRLAGSQQQIVGTIAKLGTQKTASHPRPAPAPAPKDLTPPQSEVR